VDTGAQWNLWTFGPNEIENQNDEVVRCVQEVGLKMAVFWIVVPCSIVEVYRRLRRLIALMMEAASTSETSVNFCRTIWRNNPEDSHLHTRRHENLKSHKKWVIILSTFIIKSTSFISFSSCTPVKAQHRHSASEVMSLAFTSPMFKGNIPRCWGGSVWACLSSCEDRRWFVVCGEYFTKYTLAKIPFFCGITALLLNRRFSDSLSVSSECSLGLSKHICGCLFVMLLRTDTMMHYWPLVRESFYCAYVAANLHVSRISLLLAMAVDC
jgi:hypothetical protein